MLHYFHSDTMTSCATNWDGRNVGKGLTLELRLEMIEEVQAHLSEQRRE